MYSRIVRTKKEILYILIRAFGPVTCEELEEKARMLHQTVSARLAEMTASRRIRVVGYAVGRDGRNVRQYCTN